MRIAALLFPLFLFGCGWKEEDDRNGLSTEWTETRGGSRTALLVKRNGVVIAEIGAVSNAFFVTTNGSDGRVDLEVGYYGDVGSDAQTPDQVIRVIYDGMGSFPKTVAYDSAGKIEAENDGQTLKPGAQQDEAHKP
jgi:hypothetical protein